MIFRLRLMILKTICKMNILLDTHILLWQLTDNPKLSKQKSEIIENKENQIFFSIASLWKIGIKNSIGKLEITQPIANIVPNEIVILDLKVRHIEKMMSLPFNHRDPFDRILIAQAQSENFMIMTDDDYFKQYSVSIL